MRRSSRATSRPIRSACHARGARPPCRRRRATGARRSRSASSRTASVGILRRSGSSRSGRRRSRSTVARWNAGLRGANGRGSSIVATRRIGPGKSSVVKPHRGALLGQRQHAVAGAAALLLERQPPGRPGAGPSTTSPGRSLSRRLSCTAWAARRASSRVASSRAVLLDVAVRNPGARRVPAASCSRVFSSCRVSTTASRSAWYCANERSSRRRASSRWIPLNEVGGHVVGGAERRRERVGAARREPGDLVEAHERVPEHDGVADVVDAAPARTPGELGVLAGGQQLVMLAGELRQLLDHHRAGRHVDAERQGLRGEHDLEQSRGEGLLDCLLHRRDHPRVVRGDPGLQARDPRVVTRAPRGRRRRGSRGARRRSGAARSGRPKW